MTTPPPMPSRPDSVPVTKPMTIRAPPPSTVSWSRPTASLDTSSRTAVNRITTMKMIVSGFFGMICRRWVPTIVPQIAPTARHAAIGQSTLPPKE